MSLATDLDVIAVCPESSLLANMVQSQTSSLCAGVSLVSDFSSADMRWPYRWVARLIARSFTELCLRTSVSSRSMYSRGRFADVAVFDSCQPTKCLWIPFDTDLILENQNILVLHEVSINVLNAKSSSQRTSHQIRLLAVCLVPQVCDPQSPGRRSTQAVQRRN